MEPPEKQRKSEVPVNSSKLKNVFRNQTPRSVGDWENHLRTKPIKYFKDKIRIKLGKKIMVVMIPSFFELLYKSIHSTSYFWPQNDMKMVLCYFLFSINNVGKT